MGLYELPALNTSHTYTRADALTQSEFTELRVTLSP